MKNLYDREYLCRVNGVELHVVEAGPEGGTPLLFLHGFPEFWYGWKNQIRFFASRGFRVIVPDQRGYNLSSKPVGVEFYKLGTLVKDIQELLTYLGLRDVFLAGHDWGGIVTWQLAVQHPELFKKVIVLNVPHPAALKSGFSFIQVLKSWYIYFFQLPFLPEWMLKRKRFQKLVAMMGSTARGGTFKEYDMELYRQAWKGSLKSMINWYRAMKYSREFRDHIRRPGIVHLPLLFIWGRQDATLSFKLAKASLQYCKDVKFLFFSDATHWVQHEKSEEVNDAIFNFISG